MSGQRVPDLTALTAPADNDLLLVTDVDDTTDDSAGTSKRALISSIRIPQLAAFGTSAPYTTRNLIRVGDPSSSSGGNTAFSANKLYAVPDYEHVGSIINAIALRKAQTTPTVNAHMMIFADNGSRYPGSLLVDAGAISFGGSHSGIEYWTTSPLPYTVLSGQIVWYAVMFDNTPPTVGTMTSTDGRILGFSDPGTSNPTETRIFGLSVAYTYSSGAPATFPASATIVTGAASMPGIFRGYSSV